LCFTPLPLVSPSPHVTKVTVRVTTSNGANFLVRLH
jgi:hypothetical protein